MKTFLNPVRPGIPEADTKAMISGGNVHTMTVMENKDGSMTTSTNNSSHKDFIFNLMIRKKH